MDVLILTSNDVNEVTKKIKNKCEQFVKFKTFLYNLFSQIRILE